ncbi:MAG: DUF1080 domain-containing protein [Planctomycetota bacterium]|nr:DUF1080 domain-containing protein [Planctomycetota bacterium]MDA1215001.1 DUF1080 domain-containing protein [Planctomycetota bacterium]
MLRPHFLLKLTLNLACAALLLADTSADAGRRRRRGCCDEQPSCCGTTSETSASDEEPAPAPMPAEETPYEEADAPAPTPSDEPEAPAPEEAAAENNVPPEGFTALFNGEDLTGWKGLVGNPKSRAEMTPEQLEEAQKVADASMNEHWSVQDGVIVFDGKGESLCTAKDYANFELMVDWKIEAGGDSGIYLRGSPQVQIWDTEHEPLFGAGADKGSGSLWNNQEHEKFPSVKADKPVGEWNSFHIKMIGERVQVTLNGTLVFDDIMENYWERDKPIYSTGQIELQNHGNTLNFRNIYIKELPEDATFE